MGYFVLLVRLAVKKNNSLSFGVFFCYFPCVFLAAAVVIFFKKNTIVLKRDTLSVNQ